jgi:transcription elongation factor GreA
MTPEGFKRLKAEVKQLKEIERPKIIREIATAREHGDLSENAEYHAAREKQGMIEARIAIVDDALAGAEVIDPKTLAGSKIAFGAFVTVVTASGDELRYQLVGPMEADIDQGRLSIASPIGRALLGKEVGDEVHVKTPGGVRVLEVLAIEYK